MEIVINKDVTKYKAEQWKGLSSKQIIVGGGLSISVMGGLFIFYYIFKVPLLISCTMIAPVAIGLGLLGFYEPDGMSLWAYLKRNWNRKPLLYRSIREEGHKAADSAPMSRIQEIYGNVMRIYNRIVTDRRVIRILELGRVAVRRMLPIIKAAIKILRGVSEKVWQTCITMKKAMDKRRQRSGHEKEEKKEGGEAE